MNKALIDGLAAFCVEQQQKFLPGAWLARHIGSSVVSSVAVATVAKYLSMTSWYGHADALEAIAVELHPTLARAEGYTDAAQSCNFDPGRFSIALRYRLAMRQIERAIQNSSPVALASGYSMADDQRALVRDPPPSRPSP